MAVRKKRRPADEADLDITPMIDVTFLLLIFFMVSSTMQPAAEVDVPPARHGIGVENNSLIMVQILNDGGAGRLVAGDRNGEELSLEGIQAYVAEEIKTGKQRVCLKADRELPTGRIAEVARAIQEVGEMQFYVAVKDTQE